MLVLRFIMISVVLLLQISCDSGDKKVYKKFDTSKTYENQTKSLSDSKEDGGYGFESIASSDGWVTNTSPNISGDPKINLVPVHGDSGSEKSFRFWFAPVRSE